MYLGTGFKILKETAPYKTGFQLTVTSRKSHVIIYMSGVLRRTKEYFNFATSIVVEGNREVTARKPPPSAGSCETFLRTAEESKRQAKHCYHIIKRHVQEPTYLECRTHLFES